MSRHTDGHWPALEGRTHPKQPWDVDQPYHLARYFAVTGLTCSKQVHIRNLQDKPEAQPRNKQACASSFLLRRLLLFQLFVRLPRVCLQQASQILLLIPSKTTLLVPTRLAAHSNLPRAQ